MLEGGPDIRYVEAMMGHDSSEEEREAISNGDDLLVRKMESDDARPLAFVVEVATNGIADVLFERGEVVGFGED